MINDSIIEALKYRYYSVSSGINFGADFVCYTKDPARSHAEELVVVLPQIYDSQKSTQKRSRSEQQSEGFVRGLSPQDICTVSRVAHTAGKELNLTYSTPVVRSSEVYVKKEHKIVSCIMVRSKNI